MSEHLYFDCNAAFGPRAKKHAEARWTRHHLLEDMDLAGIAGALVTYSQSFLYDPMLSNLSLIEQIADDRDRLYPCWVAIPSLSGEFPDVDAFMAEARRHDVRAVRIEPKLFNLPVKENVWGPLRDALRDEGILTIASANVFETDFDAIDRLLDIFDDCNTLLTHHNWAQWRRVVCLMNDHPRLHVEFSAFQANRAVEYFAGKYGPERCLFGTGLPEKAPGAARGFLDWTLLPRQEASLIAGGNLRRLLGGRGPGEAPGRTRWDDGITDAVRNGRPLPCVVADDHCHVLHDGAHTAGGDRVMLHGDVDGMIELTRRIGIDKTAMMSWTGPLCMDTDFGNRIVEEAVKRYPDEIVGVATINPEHQTEAEIEQVIRYYHEELGFPGLKTYTRPQNLRYDDPAFDRWYSHADAHNLYLVLDPAGQLDDQVANVARKYPNMGIHLDHCGQSWQYAKWAVSWMREYPNIWAQLNYTLVANGVIEFLVEQVGADRVLFGTDAPMRDPRPQAAWLAFTRLSEQDKRKIYGENFVRILRAAKVAM